MGMPVTVLSPWAASSKGSWMRTGLKALVQVHNGTDEQDHCFEGTTLCLQAQICLKSISSDLFSKVKSHDRTRCLHMVLAFGMLTLRGSSELGSLGPSPQSLATGSGCACFPSSRRDEPVLHTPDVSSPAEPSSSKASCQAARLRVTLSHGFSLMGVASLQGMLRRPMFVFVFCLTQHGTSNLFYIWG